MKNLKKYALILIAASLCLSLGNISGMQRIEQFGQDAIERIANSSAWTWICKKLLYAGIEYKASESFNGHTYEELFPPTKMQQMLLVGAQLTGQICPKVPKAGIPEITDHDLDDTTQCPMIGNANQIALSQPHLSPQLELLTSALPLITPSQNSYMEKEAGQQKSSYASIYSSALTKWAILIGSGLAFNLYQWYHYFYPQNPSVKLNVFIHDYKYPIQQVMPQYDVHFSTENGNTIGCSLNRDLTLTCCPKNNITVCLSFNILDNADPLHNCCIVDSNGKINCSTGFCNIPTASQGLCSSAILPSIDSLMEAPENENIIKAELQISNAKIGIRTGCNIPTLHATIRKMEKAFNLDPSHRIWYVKGYASNEMVDGVAEDGMLFISEQSFLPIESLIGHELAHVYQTQNHHALRKEKIVNLDRMLGPGSEIDADILGALAALNHESVKKYAIGLLRAYAPESYLAKVLRAWLYNFGNLKFIFMQDNPTLQHLCSHNMPTINQENVHEINNIRKTDLSIDPHPHPVVRATILFKLDTMIRAYVQFVDDATNVCPK